jgi:C1A family cysteine protease
LPLLDFIPPNLNTIIQNAIYSFGVPAPAVLASYTPGADLPPPPAVPAVKSLVADMSPVRSQGGRSTCSAFSSIAAFEHNVRKHPAPFGNLLLDLSDSSEQWLYYRCKKMDGNSGAGTLVSTAYKSLLNDGTVPEVNWPYQPVPTATEDGGPPLAVLPEPALLAIGTQTKIKESRALNGTSVADFRSAIDSERAVTFWVPIFDSWVKNPWAAMLGQITIPVPNEMSSAAHAMCAVGYIDQPEFPEIGGGRFIVRNSWGEEWGLLNPWSDRVTLPRGYGTIPYAYITKFGQEADIINRGPFE